MPGKKQNKDWVPSACYVLLAGTALHTVTLKPVYATDTLISVAAFSGVKNTGETRKARVPRPRGVIYEKSSFEQALLKKTTGINAQISQLQQAIPTESRQEKNHALYQKKLQALHAKRHEQFKKQQQSTLSHEAQLEKLLSLQQEISKEREFYQLALQSLQSLSKKTGLSLIRQVNLHTDTDPDNFFHHVAQHTRRNNPLSPLLEKTEELYCSDNKQDAALILHQLFDISPEGHDWPDEWLGHKPETPMLYAGTIDILLSTLRRNIQRFPELSELTERVTLQWDFCPVTDYGSGFYNLFLKDKKISKIKASPYPPSNWKGFQQWGFLTPPPHENNRYIPTLLAAHEPYHAFEIFLHRIYRQHCFPHPETGKIFTETDATRVLTRAFYPPQPEEESQAYPFTWQPICEIPQVRHKQQATWPARLLQRATYNLKTIKNKDAALIKKINQLKLRKTTEQQAFTTISKKLKKEIHALKSAEEQRKSVIASQRQELSRLKLVAKKTEQDIQEKLAAQQRLADANRKRVEMAIEEKRRAALAKEAMRLAKLTAEKKRRAEQEEEKEKEKEKQRQLAKLETRKRRRVEQEKREQQRLAKLKAKNKRRVEQKEQQRLISLKAMQEKLKRAGKTDFTSKNMPSQGFIPLADAGGTAPVITANGKAKTKDKLGITATAIYTHPLSGAKPSAKLSVSWAPSPNWFARAALKYVNSEDFTYSWGMGYSNWRPGTTSIQLNNWGPIKAGEGLAMDKAVLSVSHKVDSEYLRDKKISTSLGISRPLSGDAAFNATFQWSPVKNWYFRTTASQKLHGEPTKWSYGFGYFDWRPNTWRVEYSNYGNNRYPFDNFREGAITINQAWSF